MDNRLLHAMSYLWDAIIGAWPWVPALLALAVLGQTDTPTAVFPKFDFGSLSATAILGWYAWHTTTYTIPNIVKGFREELKESRLQFFQELKEARAHYKHGEHNDQ